MPRLNYMSRPKKKKQKMSIFEKQERTIAVILSYINANKTATTHRIRKTLKLSYDDLYQYVNDLQHNYKEYVSWNKKERTFTHIKKYVIEEEIIIKPLCDEEVKTINVMKQEIQK